MASSPCFTTCNLRENDDDLPDDLAANHARNRCAEGEGIARRRQEAERDDLQHVRRHGQRPRGAGDLPLRHGALPQGVGLQPARAGGGAAHHQLRKWLRLLHGGAQLHRRQALAGAAPGHRRHPCRNHDPRCAAPRAERVHPCHAPEARAAGPAGRRTLPRRRILREADTRCGPGRRGEDDLQLHEPPLRDSGRRSFQSARVETARAHAGRERRGAQVTISRRWLLPLAGGTVLVYFLSAVPEERVSANNPGGAAPAFVLPDLQGKPVALDSFRGRPTLLNFWATWCPPCRVEMPDLESLSEAKDNCLTVVGIAVGSGGPEVVGTFARKYGLRYQMVI